MVDLKNLQSNTLTPVREFISTLTTSPTTPVKTASILGNFMSPKDLKKLAAACRAAGIRSFKNSEVEFTLTDELPLSNYKQKIQTQDDGKHSIETDGWNSLTPEEQLMWSSGATVNEA